MAKITITKVTPVTDELLKDAFVELTEPTLCKNCGVSSKDYIISTDGFCSIDCRDEFNKKNPEPSQQKEQVGFHIIKAEVFTKEVFDRILKMRSLPDGLLLKSIRNDMIERKSFRTISKEADEVLKSSKPDSPILLTVKFVASDFDEKEKIEGRFKQSRCDGACRNCIRRGETSDNYIFCNYWGKKIWNGSLQGCTVFKKPLSEKIINKALDRINGEMYANTTKEALELFLDSIHQEENHWFKEDAVIKAIKNAIDLAFAAKDKEFQDRIQKYIEKVKTLPENPVKDAIVEMLEEMKSKKPTENYPAER